MTIKPDAAIQPIRIAPCGMNCGICIGFLRDRNPCAGCFGDDGRKPRHCVICRIKNCEELKAPDKRFCFQCAKFPCARLKQLDKRYRTKYHMSMIANLELIREIGPKEFVARERLRWTCPDCGGVLSAHRDACPNCGSPVNWEDGVRGSPGADQRGNHE